MNRLVSSEGTISRRKLLSRRWEQLSLTPSLTIDCYVDAPRSLRHRPVRLALDGLEHRYALFTLPPTRFSLLTATNDEFCLYDLDRVRDGARDGTSLSLSLSPPSTQQSSQALLSTVNPRPDGRLIEVAWLPGDNGIICSSHCHVRESDLLVWDASRLTPVETISLVRSRDHPGSSSNMDYPLAMLLTGASTSSRVGIFDVAVGTPNRVHLVDLRAGALVQRLAVPSRGTGGNEAISSLAWDSQWTLYGGTGLGRIIAWDVRRAEGQPYWMLQAMPQCITQMDWLGSPRAGHLLCGTIGGQSLGLIRLPDRRDVSTMAIDDTDSILGRNTNIGDNSHDDANEQIIWRTDGGRVPGTIFSRWILTMETMLPLLICPEMRGAGAGVSSGLGLKAYNGITGELEWTRLTAESAAAREDQRGDQLRTGHFEHLLYDPRGLQLISANSVYGTIQFFPL